VYDLYAGLGYQITDHVALGVSVNSVKMDVGVSKKNLDGNLDWRYDGDLFSLNLISKQALAQIWKQEL